MGDEIICVLGSLSLQRENTQKKTGSQREFPRASNEDLCSTTLYTSLAHFSSLILEELTSSNELSFLLCRTFEVVFPHLVYSAPNGASNC